MRIARPLARSLTVVRRNWLERDRSSRLFAERRATSPRRSAQCRR